MSAVVGPEMNMPTTTLPELGQLTYEQARVSEFVQKNEAGNCEYLSGNCKPICHALPNRHSAFRSQNFTGHVGFECVAWTLTPRQLL